MKITKFQLITLFVFGFLAVGAVMVFAGLGRGPDTSQVGEITVWGTLPEAEMQRMFKDLQSSKTINFNVAYTGYGEQEFDTKLINALASNKGPDAILLSDDLIARHEDKIYKISFASYKQRDFYDTFVDEANVFVTNDGIIGFPLVIDPVIAYWNKDIFTKSGVTTFPKTWESLVTLLPQLTIKDERGGVSQPAVGLGGYANIANAKDIVSSILMQAGEQITARGASGAIFSSLGSGAAPALAFYTQFADPAQTTYTWNNALQNSRTLFEAGKLAIYFGRAREYYNIVARNPHLNFDVAVMPQRASGGTPAVYGKIYALAALKNSSRVSAAFAAGSILSDANVLSVLSQNIRLAPARRDLLAAETYDPTLAIVNKSAIMSRSWLDPNPTATDEVFRNAIEAISSGQSKEEAAVLYISEQLGKLLKTDNGN